MFKELSLLFLFSFSLFESFCVAEVSKDSFVDRSAYTPANLNSQFIRISDPRVSSVAKIPIKENWWSRPHEYAWASQFVGKDLVVLDAACGISHPFKWYLSESCKETWACDIDPRITSGLLILQETLDDLGQEAYKVLSESPHYFDHVHLIRASITQLPVGMPLFDRIFCISSLEHLCSRDQRKALAEFARFLAPNGLVVITVDYPSIALEWLLETAQSVGLVPAGLVDFNRPPDLLTDNELSIYRFVFKHAPEH